MPVQCQVGISCRPWPGMKSTPHTNPRAQPQKRPRSFACCGRHRGRPLSLPGSTRHWHYPGRVLDLHYFECNGPQKCSLPQALPRSAHHHASLRGGSRAVAQRQPYCCSSRRPLKWRQAPMQHFALTPCIGRILPVLLLLVRGSPSLPGFASFAFAFSFLSFALPILRFSFCLPFSIPG